jgi:predicted GIY-YIG superfamily endonuclease
MAHVYFLQGDFSRHYLGSRVDLQVRFAQHLRGHTHTTQRLGSNLQIIASLQSETLIQARRIEAWLKKRKDPERILYYLNNPNILRSQIK